MTLSTMTRWSGLAAILGALLWIALRYFVTYSWGNPMLGLGYRGWNSLMPVPLLLLLIGVVGLHRRYGGAVGRLGRVGLAIAAIGLSGMMIGVIVEFWWAGGLAGNRTGAQVGWAIYLASYILIVTPGLWLFGVSLLRCARLRAWGVVSLVMGALILSWPLAYLWSQFLLGLGWLLLGCMLWSDRAERQARTDNGGGPTGLAIP